MEVSQLHNFINVAFGEEDWSGLYASPSVFQRQHGCIYTSRKLWKTGGYFL